ncbi:HNH endonuclease [Pseudomonas aeruginosa]|nr:HNH endonuclease [Pseudomonas aeruginosa]
MNQKTKRRKTMSKKTQFTRSKVKLGSLSWTSPIYSHGEGRYQNKSLKDNIPGYPGYHISKRGKIYSRWDVNGKGILSKRYHLKQPHLNKKGRYIIGLSQPGIGTTKWLVHRLVALVYLPNPEGLPYVCHKDNVPTNNSVNNLYWGTQKDNMSQASKEGRMIQAKGKDSVHYKGTEIQRSYIPRLINLGFTRKEISEIMNLGVQLVSDYYNKYKETYG